MANIGKYKMSQVIGLLEHNARTDETYKSVNRTLTIKCFLRLKGFLNALQSILKVRLKKLGNRLDNSLNTSKKCVSSSRVSRSNCRNRSSTHGSRSRTRLRSRTTRAIAIPHWVNLPD